MCSCTRLYHRAAELLGSSCRGGFKEYDASSGSYLSVSFFCSIFCCLFVGGFFGGFFFSFILFLFFFNRGIQRGLWFREQLLLWFASSCSHSKAAVCKQKGIGRVAGGEGWKPCPKIRNAFLKTLKDTCFLLHSIPRGIWLGFLS